MRWFPRLEPALQHAIVSPGRLVFCAEKVYPQIRQFATAYFDDFAARYEQLPDAVRHFYEVIRVDVPCHFYVDVEYDRILNPLLVEEDVVSHLKLLLCAAIKFLLGKVVLVEDIVDLRATTELKMSRHFVVQIQGVMWHDNSVVGKIMQYIHKELNNFIGSGTISQIVAMTGLSQPSIRNLYQDTPKGKKFVCDLSFYSRYQQFRLLHSSKRGKDNFLRVAEANYFPLPIDFRERLLCTLVCSETHGISVIDETGLLPLIHALSPVQRHNQVCRLPRQAGPTAATYTDLDRFVLARIRHYCSAPGASLGNIERFPEGNSIKYHVSGTRWCGNIRRDHKSNRVFFVANLTRGQLIQKCYDQVDCDNFEGIVNQIPDEINPLYKDAIFEGDPLKDEDLVGCSF